MTFQEGEIIVKKTTSDNPRRAVWLEKIMTTAVGEAIYIFITRLKTKRSQVADHLYCKCQYFTRNEPNRTFLGYLAAGRKEASFADMVFISADGSVPADDPVEAKIRLFAVRPCGNNLMYVRRQAAQSGADIFGKVVSNTQDPIYYYKLGKDGKIQSAPRKLQERAKLLRSETCYLFTDAGRSFTLYLTGSRNELWQLPIL